MQKGNAMPGIRNVISTLTNDGQEVMGSNILLWHYPHKRIVQDSRFCDDSRARTGPPHKHGMPAFDFIFLPWHDPAMPIQCQHSLI